MDNISTKLWNRDTKRATSRDSTSIIRRLKEMYRSAQKKERALVSTQRRLKAFNIYIAKSVEIKMSKSPPFPMKNWYKSWIQLYLNEVKKENIILPKQLMIQVTLVLLGD